MSTTLLSRATKKISAIAFGALISQSSFADPSFNTIESVVVEIAGDAYNGRTIGSIENETARFYLANQLASLGVSPAGTNPGDQVNGYFQPFTGYGHSGKIYYGTNVAGVYYPPGTQGQAPSVMLFAHFDGIDSTIGHCDDIDSRPIPRRGFSSVCNAAVDNATGVASIVAMMEDLRSRVQSPIAVVFFDGEEPGLFGSNHFSQTPTFDNSDLQLLINMESIGYNSFPNMDQHAVVLGAHSGGSRLTNDIDSVMATTGLDYQQSHYALAQGRNDLEGFVKNNWNVPYLLFTDGSVSVYHTSADQYLPGKDGPVNLNKTHQVAIAAADLVETVSSSNRYYSYSAVQYQTVNGRPFIHPPYSVHQDLLDYIEFCRASLSPYSDAHALDKLEILQAEVEDSMGGFFTRYFWNRYPDRGYKLLNETAMAIYKLSRDYTLDAIDNGLYD